MTRKEKQEAAEKKRAALHLEFMCAMQDKYRACIEHGEKAKEALKKATAEIINLAGAKIKACPQEKAFIEGVMIHIFHQLSDGLTLKSMESKKGE